jgi:hypothetical protein
MLIATEQHQATVRFAYDETHVPERHIRPARQHSDATCPRRLERIPPDEI